MGQGPSRGVRGPPIGYTKVPKMTFLGHKRVLWLQSDKTVWNKGGTSQGTSGVVLRNSFVGHRGPSRGIKGHIKGPMRSKTSFFGHKWVWWFQFGGTVWDMGGTSQGTFPVMHWNSFAGQGEPSGGARGPPKGSKTAKNSLFGP